MRPMKTLLAFLLAGVAVSSICVVEASAPIPPITSSGSIPILDVDRTSLSKLLEARIEAGKSAIVNVRVTVKDSPAKNTSTILNGAGTSAQPIKVDSTTTFMDKGEGAIMTGDLIVEGNKKMPTVSWQRPAQIKHSFTGKIFRIDKDNYILEWEFSKIIEHLDSREGKEGQRKYVAREFLIKQSTALSRKEFSVRVPIICQNGRNEKEGCEAIATFYLNLLEPSD